MPSLTAAQKTAVTQFVSFTTTDKKIAERVLKAHNWNVQQAVNGYFAGNQGQATASTPTTAALNKLFDKYRDSPKDSPNTISIEGTMNYLSDLNIALDHVSVLVTFHLLSSPSIGELTRDEFIAGWAPYNATTIPAQKAIVDKLTSQLPTPSARADRDCLFPKVYRHTFTMALQPPKRSMDLEDAVTYWRLLFAPPSVAWEGDGGEPPWLEWWVEFVEGQWKRAVNRDVWDQTRVFAERCLADGSLEWWSEEGSWPSVVDEFVGWVREVKWAGRGFDGKGGTAAACTDAESMDVE